MYLQQVSRENNHALIVHSCTGQNKEDKINKREHRSKSNPTTYLKTGTNKGIGQETHIQTKRARIHRQEVNLSQ